MKKTTLKFLKPFCDGLLVNSANDFYVAQTSVVINASDIDISINGSTCAPWTSVVCENVTISGHQLIVIPINHDSPELSKYIHAEKVSQDWQNVYDVFGIESLKNVPLWRSKKDYSIPGVELNLWYAPEGTNCGIHNTHDFLELHTQVHGLGIMQKFTGEGYETLYQNVFMPLGLTHEPFCDEGLVYPWHQYKCVTDCIWLAIEFHDLEKMPSSLKFSTL